MALADDIETVRGHVRLGSRHIAQQRELIAELERLELPIAKAIEFLQLLETLQELREVHLSRLLRKATENNAA
ncbi:MULTISPECIES: hypothetical protein [unclassified Mesorhizobium]|uniref:hypothetical protein n=1 Tax=unclassified Mesorhizobium TaxID=325217 RepID=UPI000FCCA985|nr:MULTISPECIES: hypothetical protein [unclassified Mesorhizobium]RUV11943.1 hypothetical protein EOA91_28960 [Mesorhizobium sp. M1A.F.Ca.IN.022.04.1.1]RWG24811.1 MAG: hypothetical protein EOQ60_31285 [Mesorhizobium sp.]TIS16912.1 MAG: hypothetical protein E5X10_05740 [Mesorhizobium sp.]